MRQCQKTEAGQYGSPHGAVRPSAKGTRRPLRRPWGRFVLSLSVLCLLLGGCFDRQRVVYIPIEDRLPQRSSASAGGWRGMGTGLSPGTDEDTVAVLKDHFSGWQGIPYRRGGLSRKGIDCSGFVQVTYRELFGKDLPRTVAEQVKTGQTVARRAVQPGDLVFFKTGVRQRHVGIYVGNNLFLHASLSSGVTLSSLQDAYWQNTYWQSKRL